MMRRAALRTGIALVTIVAATRESASVEPAEVALIATHDVQIEAVDGQQVPTGSEVHVAPGRHSFLVFGDVRLPDLLLPFAQHAPLVGSRQSLSWNVTAGSCYGLQNHGPEIHHATAFMPELRGVACPDLAKQNLALHGAAVASSKQSEGQQSHDASAASDGDPRTRWASEFDDDQYLYADLGSVQSIGTVILRWETAFAKEYHIDLSDDATRWTNTVEVTDGAGGNDALPLPEGSRGRYVRLSAVKRSTPYGFSLWELEAYAAHLAAARGIDDARGTPRVSVVGNMDATVEVAGDLPLHASRLYAHPSAKVWAAAKAVVAELGMKTAPLDEKAQAFRTEPSSISKSWRLPDVGTTLDKIQLQVFVSPFVEPAHVHVRVVGFVKDNRTMGLPALGNWMFDRLEARLGDKGRALPAGWTKRAQLTHELQASATKPSCTPSLPAPENVSRRAKAVAAFHTPAVSPQPAGATGATQVAIVILEDGASIPAGAESNANDEPSQFLAAAVHAANLWLFEPTRVGTCPVPATAVMPVFTRTSGTAQGRPSGPR